MTQDTAPNAIENPWHPFSEESLGPRGKRFYAVRNAMRALLGPAWVVGLRQNDALEWTLDIGRDGSGDERLAVWIVGMIDEPVWGYDLEVKPDQDDVSWDLVKSVSLELPEMSDSGVVAQMLHEAILRDDEEVQAMPRDGEVSS